MLNLWDKVTIKDFTGDMADLAGAIGVPAVKKIIEIYGGDSLYCLKSETIIRAVRDRRVNEEFTGFNYRELAKQYNLSVQQIRNIVQEQRSKKKSHSQTPIEKQMNLF